jgi:ubiquinone/menaquinone biosynthesis C-methylase UbiE
MTYASGTGSFSSTGTAARKGSGSDGSLPDYDKQLSDFHRSFEHELQAIVNQLPLSSNLRVLDLACGDGFYTRRIADRLGPGGAITGVDINRAYLSEAGEEASCQIGRAQIDFIAASFDHLPFRDGTFDLVWCAQSLFTLPDPVAAIRHMVRVVRRGGIIAVLENDTLHEVCLPWPVYLELPLRAAELRFFLEESQNSSKYYVGRRLPKVLAEAGLEPMGLATHAFDRQAPLGEAEKALLRGYLKTVVARVSPHLEARLLQELHQLVDPGSPTNMLEQPHLTVTWLNVLALGRKPAG